MAGNFKVNNQRDTWIRTINLTYETQIVPQVMKFIPWLRLQSCVVCSTTKQATTKQWTSYIPDFQIKRNDAFKNIVILPPVPKFSYSCEQMVLDLEDYDVQIGCLLLQKHPNNTVRPIGYWARFLHNAKQWYDTIQGECPDIFKFLICLCIRLEGTCCAIRTERD